MRAVHGGVDLQFGEKRFLQISTDFFPTEDDTATRREHSSRGFVAALCPGVKRGGASPFPASYSQALVISAVRRFFHKSSRPGNSESAIFSLPVRLPILHLFWCIL